MGPTLAGGTDSSAAPALAEHGDADRRQADHARHQVAERLAVRGQVVGQRSPRGAQLEVVGAGRAGDVAEPGRAPRDDLMANISLALLVLKTRQVERLWTFYNALGIELIDPGRKSGSVWESNPQGALFTPPTGFEDQGRHQTCKHSQGRMNPL